MSIAHRDVVAILGPVDEEIIADIASTGASAEELARAFAWVNSDEVPLGGSRPRPSGKVAELIELLSPSEDDR